MGYWDLGAWEIGYKEGQFSIPAPGYKDVQFLARNLGIRRSI